MSFPRIRLKFCLWNVPNGYFPQIKSQTKCKQTQRVMADRKWKKFAPGETLCRRPYWCTESAGTPTLAWFDRLIVWWVPYLRFNPFQFVYCLESRQFNWSRRTPAGKRSLWEAGGHWFESHPGPTFVRHNVGPVVVWKSRNQCTSCLLGGCYCRNCCGASLLANFWQCCGEGQVQVCVT